MVHGPDGLHGLVEDGPSDFFLFSFLFVFLTLYYFYIFLFLYITKASPR
jgi:hypothetical protein